VGNIFHGKNPNTQGITHQKPQGMTEKYQGDKGLGRPWVFGENR